jgi:hypothetical protein
MWKKVSARFIDFLMHVMDADLAATFQQIAAIGENELFSEALFPYFVEYVLDAFADEVKAYRYDFRRWPHVCCPVLPHVCGHMPVM